MLPEFQRLVIGLMLRVRQQLLRREIVLFLSLSARKLTAGLFPVPPFILLGYCNEYNEK
jgi:hypothetical protein